MAQSVVVHQGTPDWTVDCGANNSKYQQQHNINNTTGLKRNFRDNSTICSL